MTVQQDLNQVVKTLLVLVVEQLVLNKIVDKPLLLDEQLVQRKIDDEMVLHMSVVVEEMCRTVEQLVKPIGDIVIDCTKVDDYCSMKHGPHVALDMHTTDQSLTRAYPLLI
ncbi:hypothetical protein Tco_1264117 [Tanacetum coccineum]